MKYDKLNALQNQTVLRQTKVSIANFRNDVALENGITEGFRTVGLNGLVPAQNFVPMTAVYPCGTEGAYMVPPPHVTGFTHPAGHQSLASEHAIYQSWAECPLESSSGASGSSLHDSSCDDSSLSSGGFEPDTLSEQVDKLSLSEDVTANEDRSKSERQDASISSCSIGKQPPVSSACNNNHMMSPGSTGPVTSAAGSTTVVPVTYATYVIPDTHYGYPMQNTPVTYAPTNIPFSVSSENIPVAKVTTDTATLASISKPVTVTQTTIPTNVQTSVSLGTVANVTTRMSLGAPVTVPSTPVSSVTPVSAPSPVDPLPAVTPSQDGGNKRQCCSSCDKSPFHCLGPLYSRMEIVWHGEFDRLFAQYYHKWHLIPTLQNPTNRWKMFKDSAKVRFCCKNCGHGWTSMKGRVAFWFNLEQQTGTGYVMFKLFGQCCIKCQKGDFEHAMWYPEEVIKVVGNVYNRIGQEYYGFVRPPLRIDRRSGKPRNQHNAKLCQACRDGICREEFNVS